MTAAGEKFCKTDLKKESEYLYMIRKYHYYPLQTNPQHHEEEPQNTNSHQEDKVKQRALFSSSFY